MAPSALEVSLRVGEDLERARAERETRWSRRLERTRYAAERAARQYVAYYNGSRCHQSLGGNAPEPRPVEDSDGSIYAIPHLGGPATPLRRPRTTR